MGPLDYREIEPSPVLRALVRCYWTLRGPGVEGSAGAGDASAAGLERIVPDGCAEIVLNRAECFRRHRDGRSHLQAEVLLVGQIRRSIAIAPTGDIDLFGVRFEPGGPFPLLGLPMHELADLDLDLGAVDARLGTELRGAGEREDDRARLDGVEAALLAALARRVRGSSGGGGRSGESGLVPAAVRGMEGGLASAGAVARSLHVSRRTLERAFRREVGLAPRLYLRIRRLQGVLRRFDAGAALPGWAVLAAEHGYADQSHLIRDFRALAGTTPRRYLAERTPMARCFEAGDLSRSSNP